MHSDPIADMATRIRNAILAGHSQVVLPYSKIKEFILKVLQKEGVINDFNIQKSEDFEEIVVSFNQNNNLKSIRRISKPGRRHYVKFSEIKPVRRGFGFLVISTSKGVMTGLDAYRQKVGGEILLEIY